MCIVDIPKKRHHKTTTKKSRSFKHLNIDHFQSKLLNINWQQLFFSKDSENCLKIFLNKIESIFDDLAPFKMQTKREAKSENSPWITAGIQKSIDNRDRIYKLFLKEKNKDRKNALHARF